MLAGTRRVMHVVAGAVAAALFAVLLAGCVGGSQNTWTLAIYLCGSNLESKQQWATKTLNELKGIDVPANVTLVVQAGGAKHWHADEVSQNGVRLEVRGGQATEVGQVGDDSMGEAGTLAGFLSFVQESYPADHTAVVLWDHGGGPLVGACFDEGTRFDALTLPELDKAFSAGVEARGGAPYDIVGFDCCLMGSLETAALLADSAEWLVASEEIEAGAGWDYGPLVGELGSGAGAREACVAACDGYVAKSEKRGKDASATLAAIDLSKVDPVCDALDAALAATRAAKGDDAAALRALAYGVRQAESFGGASRNEGHTNLVDLLGAAQSAATSDEYGEAWLDLADKCEEAIAYHVCGRATTGANGLSVWYPVSSTADEVAAYAGVSPLEGYAAALTDLYSEGVGHVAFKDAGSVGEDGRVTVTIDPSSAGSFFDLYVVNRRTDGSYADTNEDIYDDWDTLTFSYAPADAVAITLDGMVLDADVIGYGDGWQTFSSPVEVGGSRTNLRTTWVSDEREEGGGHYEVLGTWDGIDALTGLADRSLDDLEAGSVVAAVSSVTGEARGTVTLGPAPVVGEAPMEPGTYECWFVALDLLGNEYPSEHVEYEVSDDGASTIVSVGGKPVVAPAS